MYVGTTPCSATSPMHWESGIAVARYTPAGRRLWGKLLAKATHSGVAAVASDPAGNLIVAGFGPVRGGGAEWRLIKLSPAGKQLWHARLRGVAKSTAPTAPQAVVVDAAGNVYVCGQLAHGNTGTDAALAKFSRRGKLLWKRFLDGSAHGDDLATGLARDPAGHIYVAGHLEEVGHGYDVFVARYAAHGHRTWLRLWDNRSTSGDDCAWAVAASSAGVAVAGSTQGAWNSAFGQYDNDGLVLKYAPNGDFVYEWIVPGTAWWGEFSAVSIDAVGNVAAAGAISTGSTGRYKAVLLKLSPAPAQLYCSWLPASSDRGGFSALATRRGTLLAVGYEGSDTGSWSNMLFHTVTPHLVTTTDTYSSGAGTVNDATAVLCRGAATYVAGTAGTGVLQEKMALIRF